MSDDTLELKKRVSELPDDQLMEMVTVAAGDYWQETLDYPKPELKYLGVDWS